MARKRRKSKSKSAEWSSGEVLGVAVGAVALSAVIAFGVWKLLQGESSTEHRATTARVQAMTGFTPALFDVSPEEQKKLDAWQPPAEGISRTSRAEDFYSRRAAQRIAAAKAAAEAAATVGDD